MLHVGKRSNYKSNINPIHLSYALSPVDYSMHPHLPKQPVVTYSILSTDDTLNYQSSSETKRRIVPSTEGILDDLIIISVIIVLNGVAGQKCSRFVH